MQHQRAAENDQDRPEHTYSGADNGAATVTPLASPDVGRRVSDGRCRVRPLVGIRATPAVAHTAAGDTPAQRLMTTAGKRNVN